MSFLYQSHMCNLLTLRVQMEVMDYIITDTIPEENIIIQSVIDNLAKPRFATIGDEVVVDYIFLYCINLRCA